MPSFFEIDPPVLEKKIFEGFLPYMGILGHLGHVTWIIYIHIDYPFLLMLHIKFGFDWLSGFRGDGCLNITVIYMYIALGGGI